MTALSRQAPFAMISPMPTVLSSAFTLLFVSGAALAAQVHAADFAKQNQNDIAPERKNMKTLNSTLAGTWYPGTEKEIRRMAETWERQAAADDAKPAAPTAPNVLVLPHAGWSYSGAVAWRAVRTVQGRSFRRVIVLAPSHRVWIENRLVAPEADAVSTPLGAIPVDRDWLNRLALVAPVERNDRVHAAEHATQIEFPLLQLALEPGFTIAPLVAGALGPEQLAMSARALADLADAETLLVVSSDFTHYGADFGYTPYGTDGGPEVRKRAAAADADALSRMEAVDADGFRASLGRTGATICGHTPIELALRAMPQGTRLATLRYATSGDADGDFSRFVCYAALAGHASWTPPAPGRLDAEARDWLLRLARDAVEHAVRTGRRLPADRLSGATASALEKRGAFVTLSGLDDGSLRGCIGEILPMRPLAEVVAARAVDAALRDPRFDPVSPHELAGLRVEVSALTPPEPVASWQDIVLGRDGMTLEKNGRFAVFLPQVAPEQGWDLATTLTHLSLKAGLPADAWRSGATFETFRAEVFHE